ncbi:MAG: acetylglutamate kinase [Gammaproteobacteria bacterium]|nr:acetylglutamate kinase [Gammaproteobacteria bacterium]
MTDKKPLAVIKIGGDILIDPKEREGLVDNIRDLHQQGWDIVILHGGGPQINQLQELHGLKSNKISGRRITSKEDLKVVKQALAGEVNTDLVSLLAAGALPAFGCHGASGRIIEARKRPPIKVSGQGEKLIDFGEVGDVVAINHQLLRGLLQLEQIPVIATLGMDPEGRIFNINADTTVVQITKALKADLLLLITQIGGIYRDIADPDSLITHINPEQAKNLIETDIIQQGMIPKVEEAIRLLDDGIETIAIAAARRKGVFNALTSDNNNSNQIKATRITK